MTLERPAARRTIPKEIVTALTSNLLPGQTVKWAGDIERAEKGNNAALLERAEKAIARNAHTHAGHAFKVLAGSLGSEDKAAHAIMNLAAIEAGDPYGAHRVWYDRNDMAAILDIPEAYVSELTRKGFFDVIEYGSNPTPRGTKRWCSAKSVGAFKAMRDKGLKPAEILEKTMHQAVRA